MSCQNGGACSLFMMKPFQGRCITFSNVVSQHFHFSAPSSRISISTVTPKRTFWKILFKNIKINHWSQKSRKQKHNLTEVFIRWLGSHQPFFWDASNLNIFFDLITVFFFFVCGILHQHTMFLKHLESNNFISSTLNYKEISGKFIFSCKILCFSCLMFTIRFKIQLVGKAVTSVV